jgi:hypothetical protein
LGDGVRLIFGVRILESDSTKPFSKGVYLQGGTAHARYIRAILGKRLDQVTAVRLVELTVSDANGMSLITIHANAGTADEVLAIVEDEISKWDGNTC